MHASRPSLLPVVAAVILSLLVPVRAGTAPSRGQYRVHDLGRLGGFRSEARGINARGEIAGLSTSDAGYRAVRWRWDTTGYVIQDLGPGEACGVADDGTVAGLTGSGEGALWSPTGTLTSLGTTGRLSGISGSGRVVGWLTLAVTNPSPPFNVKFPRHAARFAGSAGFDLALHPEWDCTVAGVDRHGALMVGSVLTNIFASGQPTHAWLFPDRDLHTLAGFANSFALAVNASGQVVGHANNVNTGPFNQPMLWSELTGMRLLTAPPGTPYGSALGINDAGQAVGALGSSAVMWVNVGQSDETNVFLNSLPPSGHRWNLQAAYAINPRGEIAGYGVNPDGYVHGFCLQPTNIVERRITGTIAVLGHEPLGGVTTNWLENAEVALLRPAPGGSWERVTGGFADARARFSFTVREPLETRFALRVTLQDDIGWIEVRDEYYDSTAPAWMRTPDFAAPADTALELVMHINNPPAIALPNIAAYALNGTAFGLGGLTSPPGLPLGDASVEHDRFAPLAVIYRNLRLAARFTRDELGLSVLPVVVQAFSTSPTSWAATPGQPTIRFAGDDTWYNPVFIGGRIRGGNRPTNREFHEYGHHVMWLSALGLAPFEIPGDNHGGLTNSTSADSWVEGFAVFLGAAMADRMLDAGERTRAGLYRIGGTFVDLNRIYSLDHPFQAGRQLVSASPALWGMEDLVVGSLLWDLHSGRVPPRPPLNAYVPTITSYHHPYPWVTNVHRLYETLLAYGASRPAELDATNVTARFVQGGYYDDLTPTAPAADQGNGRFDPGETVGLTSWNPNFLHRPNLVAPPSAHVRVAARDDRGEALADLQADLRTVSPPPWDAAEIHHTLALGGSGPWEFPVLPPPPPATVLLRLAKPGLRPSPELAIDADWLLARVAAAGPDDLLLDHVFILQRPVLRAARSPEGTLRLAWPADVGDVLLETTPVLPAVTWIRFPGETTVEGPDRVAVLLPDAADRYFRLRAP